jgi:hypothetical protein
VKRFFICFRIDRDRADAEFFAGADDAQGNFSAVGDQDF